MDKKRQQQAYENYVKQKTPVHNLPANMTKAFVTGGAICVLGQGILNICEKAGLDKDISGGWCSMLLVFLSVVLTGFNVYPRIAKCAEPERWFRSPDLPIRWQHRRSNTKKKDRLWESAVRYLRLQVR